MHELVYASPSFGSQRYVDQDAYIVKLFQHCREIWAEDKPFLDVVTIVDMTWAINIRHSLSGHVLKYPLRVKDLGDALEVTFIEDEGPSFIFTEETCEWYHCPSLSRQNMIEMDLEDLQLQVERDSVLRMGVSR